MKYKIVRHQLFEVVEREVNEYLNNGWSISGSLCFCEGMTAQAITRNRKPSKTTRKKSLIPSMNIVDLYNETFKDFKATYKRAPTTALLNKIDNLTLKHFNDIEDWTTFFESLKLSPFLMGRVPPQNNYRQFKLNLDWIVNDTNLSKIIDGKFHE